MPEPLGSSPAGAGQAGHDATAHPGPAGTCPSGAGQAGSDAGARPGPPGTGPVGHTPARATRPDPAQGQADLGAEGEAPASSPGNGCPGRSGNPADGLQIAGLVPLSTVDWPDHLVATVFLQGCPWNCFYCHNHDLIPTRTPGALPWQAVRDLLARRGGLLDGVVLTGGEALRQDALADAAAEVKAAGFQVGLHTAGAYPRRLTDLLDAGLVDWVGLDLKALPEHYEAVIGAAGAVGGAKAWECLEVLVGYERRAAAIATAGPAGPAHPAGSVSPAHWTDPASPAGPAGPVATPAAGQATPAAPATPPVSGREHSRERTGQAFSFEVRTTIVPGDVTAADAYAVAKRAHAAGARRFALQQVRAQGSAGGFPTTAPGWDGECERLAARIEALGWDTFTYRPA